MKDKGKIADCWTHVGWIYTLSGKKEPLPISLGVPFFPDTVYTRNLSKQLSSKVRTQAMMVKLKTLDPNFQNDSWLVVNKYGTKHIIIYSLFHIIFKMFNLKSKFTQESWSVPVQCILWNINTTTILCWWRWWWRWLWRWRWNFFNKHIQGLHTAIKATRCSPKMTITMTMTMMVTMTMTLTVTMTIGILFTKIIVTLE